MVNVPLSNAHPLTIMVPLPSAGKKQKAENLLGWLKKALERLLVSLCILIIVQVQLFSFAVLNMNNTFSVQQNWMILSKIKLLIKTRNFSKKGYVLEYPTFRISLKQSYIIYIWHQICFLGRYQFYLAHILIPVALLI